MDLKFRFVSYPISPIGLTGSKHAKKLVESADL